MCKVLYLLQIQQFIELNDTNVFRFKKYQANRIHLLFVGADSLLTTNSSEIYVKRSKINHI